MFDGLIRLSLQRRYLVLVVAAVILAAGVYQIPSMPIDVFPDLNRPTVTIMAEAPGLGPEEVEALVTRPIEYLVNGATGVRRVRSASSIGLAIVWVEFEWGTDLFTDRQVINEKLQLARDRLPENVHPTLAPISSIMGEIMLLGLTWKRDTPPAMDDETRQWMELRTFADFTLRNRLLAVEGVSQVTIMGGILMQYQVITSPERLAAEGVTLDALTEAASKANVISGAGILPREAEESQIRISGQAFSLEDIEETPVLWREPKPVRIRDVAEVRFGGPVRRGAGSVWFKEDGKPVGGAAIILAVQKQPHASTFAVTERIDHVLDGVERELPPDVHLERRIFRQTDFLQAAVDNVFDAVRDGAIWVIVVLFFFLWNLRVGVCSLIAIPMSLVGSILVLRFLGISLNTMTLGGLAVAIGEVVDDSIVDVENICRRLKENRARTNPESTLRVIYRASTEVRNSIVFATLIVLVVVLPLFSMAGLEGRLFAPLGIAYLTAVSVSLFVAVTVTPALGSILLPGARFLDKPKDPLLLRVLKAIDERILRFSLRHASAVLAVVAILIVSTVASVAWMGGEFLPPFNEGTMTINVQTPPGTSLEESERIARRVENMLLDVPEVTSIARRTGRAELDEHAEGVNASELDVGLLRHEEEKEGWYWTAARMVPFLERWSYRRQGRPRDEVVHDIRDRISSIPNVLVNVGQPISHRLDHIMSGIRAQIAVKVFGEELAVLRATARDIEAQMNEVEGIVDLQVETQVEVPRLLLRVRRDEASRYGLTPGDIAALLETAYRGRTVSQILDGEKTFGLVVWYDERSRSDPEEINKTILDTPSGRKVPLGQVAEVLETTGPNTLHRENVERRIVVSANVAERDLAGVVREIEHRLVSVRKKLHDARGEYRIELGGQFEAQQAANRRLWILGAASVVCVFFLLFTCLESWRAALQVMINIPLAAFGAVVALLVVHRPDMARLHAAPWWEWPRVWAEATTLSVAHWVGFITLIGIVSRNGIMMISHYIYLMKEEGEEFGEAMILRGSLERLAPVLMTAITTFIGLLPLLAGAGETGKEILQPLALVVFGGMLGSTVLDQVVTPALFHKFGGKVYRRTTSSSSAIADSDREFE